MKTTIELDIPKTGAERIARENETQLFTSAAKIAAIAEPDDPHARTELMQAIIDLTKKHIERQESAFLAAVQLPAHDDPDEIPYKGSGLDGY